MLEDVLGWIVVLVGAIIMNFTDIKIIDPIMSILVSVYILYHSLGNLRRIVDIFLEKTPAEIDIEEPKDFKMYPGKGVSCKNFYGQVYAGNSKFLSENNIDVKIDENSVVLFYKTPHPMIFLRKESSFKK